MKKLVILSINENGSWVDYIYPSTCDGDTAAYFRLGVSLGELYGESVKLETIEVPSVNYQGAFVAYPFLKYIDVVDIFKTRNPAPALIDAIAEEVAENEDYAAWLLDDYLANVIKGQDYELATIAFNVTDKICTKAVELLEKHREWINKTYFEYYQRGRVPKEINYEHPERISSDLGSTSASSKDNKNGTITVLNVSDELENSNGSELFNFAYCIVDICEMLNIKEGVHGREILDNSPLHTKIIKALTGDNFAELVCGLDQEYVWLNICTFITFINLRYTFNLEPRMTYFGKDNAVKYRIRLFNRIISTK